MATILDMQKELAQQAAQIDAGNKNAAKSEMDEISRTAGLRKQALNQWGEIAGGAQKAVTTKQQVAAKMLGSFDADAQAQKAAMTQQASEGLAANAARGGRFGGYGAMLQAQQQAGQGLAQLGLQQQAERGKLEASNLDAIEAAREKAAKTMLDKLAFEAEAGSDATDVDQMKSLVDKKLKQSTEAHSSDYAGEQKAVASEMRQYAAAMPPGPARDYALYLAQQVQNGSIDV